MAAYRVKTGARYVYQPVGWDQSDPPYGVRAGLLKPGDTVVVVRLPGCPPPNTMGHCHINTLNGQFAGLVHCNSLSREANEKGKD